MLGKKEKIKEPTGELNVLGEGTTIQGSLVSNGDLRIDGKVNGNVTTQGKCVLGASGAIIGDINTTKIVIEIGGQLNGSCTMGVDVSINTVS